MTTVVHALLLLLASPPLPPGGAPVRVWLGSGPTLAAGDQERLYVQTSTDGNLVVLHARPDGRVEVLFPGDPASDPFVRAGTYEIPFASSGPEGRGMVVAALSPDPIWFDEFVHRSEWDAAALTGAGPGADPEALLTDIVQRMLGDGSFNYDVVTYTVAPRPAPIADAAGYPLQPASVCLECSFTQVYLVPFSHRRRRAPAPAPAATLALPVPAAIAVYSVHRSGAALKPLRVPLPPPSTPRRRIPEVAAAAASESTTLAVRAIPLVARTRPAAAQAAALATRSLLVLRVVHAARGPSSALVPASEPASSGVVPVSAHGLASAAPTPATGGLVAVAAAAPAPLAAPEPRVVARPDTRAGFARGATAEAAPAAARAGSATGVGLGSVHTAGWRH